MRKSKASSTRSLVGLTARALAVRFVLRSRAISPKNCPSPSTTRLCGNSISTSPEAMNTSSGLRRRVGYRRAGRNGLRAKVTHDFGDRRGVERTKQRNSRNHAPGDDKFAAMDFFRESRRDNADGKAQHYETHHHGQRGNHPARRRDWRNVAITTVAMVWIAHHIESGSIRKTRAEPHAPRHAWRWRRRARRQTG